MARATDHHGALSQADVDAMDISVVAALIKAGADPQSSVQAAAMDATRRRMEAAAAGKRPRRWGELEAM